jgi:hypothetical protein
LLKFGNAMSIRAPNRPAATLGNTLKKPYVLLPTAKSGKPSPLKSALAMVLGSGGVDNDGCPGKPMPPGQADAQLPSGHATQLPIALQMSLAPHVVPAALFE